MNRSISLDIAPILTVEEINIQTGNLGVYNPNSNTGALMPIVRPISDPNFNSNLEPNLISNDNTIENQIISIVKPLKQENNNSTLIDKIESSVSDAEKAKDKISNQKKYLITGFVVLALIGSVYFLMKKK